MALGESLIPLAVALTGVLGVAAYYSYRTNPIPDSEYSLSDEEVLIIYKVLNHLSLDRNTRHNSVLVDGVRIKHKWEVVDEVKGGELIRKRFVATIDVSTTTWNAHFVGTTLTYSKVLGQVDDDSRPDITASYKGAEEMLKWARLQAQNCAVKLL